MERNAMRTQIDTHQMIAVGDTVFVCVSGGADSICLLHRLCNLRYFHPFTLVALHVNHQLRGDESDRDEQFVRDFVATHCGETTINMRGIAHHFPAVPLEVARIDVARYAKAHRLGVEESARHCRYQFFQRMADGCRSHSRPRIATAHTADDNGETVLMNLVRGAGLSGLSGIPPVRGDIIRPLLTTTRTEVEDYLKLYNLPHIEDSTNADVTFTRNRIRHQVMPILQQLNPNFLQNIAETTPILRDENDYLSSVVASKLGISSAPTDTISLPADALGALPRSLALRGIGQLAERLSPNLVLERSHRLAVLALCDEEASPSAVCHLPMGVVARREYAKLVLTTLDAPPEVAVQTLPLPCRCDVGCCHFTIERGRYDGSFSPPDSLWIDGTISALTLRSRREGDSIQRPNRPNRTVKKLMIDEKIPHHLRNSLPVMLADGKLVGVAGLGVAQWCLPQLGEDAWHIQITINNKGDKTPC